MTVADRINIAIAIASACSVAISLGVVIVTYLIVRANRQAVAVMRAQLEATTRPYIQITPTVREMSTFMELRIVNAGTTAATDLRLSLDKDYYFNAEETEAKNIKKYTAFAQPIESLPPKAELIFHLGLGHRIFSDPRLCPLQFTVTAEYTFAGSRVLEATTVDLQPFTHSALPVNAIAERLDTMNKHLKGIHESLAQNDG